MKPIANYTDSFFVLSFKKKFNKARIFIWTYFEKKNVTFI